MKIKIGFLIKELEGLGVADIKNDFTNAIITALYKKKGEHAGTGDLLWDFENDKGNDSIMSPADGVITDVFFADGASVDFTGEEETPFGTILLPAIMEMDIGASEETQSRQKSISGDATEQSQPPDTPRATEKPRISAAVMVHARTHNLSVFDFDMEDVQVLSGKTEIDETVERVFAKYVRTKVKKDMPSVIPAVPKARTYARKAGVSLEEIYKAKGGTDVVRYGDVMEFVSQHKKETSNARHKTITPSPLRRAIAEMLAYSWTYIPHAGDTVTIDITEIAAFRERHNASAERMFGTKLRFDHFFLYATARFLATDEFSMLNNYWDPEKREIHVMPHVNIGLAADFGEGLVIPVVHGAENLSFRDLVAKTEDTIIRAKEKKLSRLDFLDLTFTVNNPGARGGEEPATIIPSTRMKEKGGIRSTSMILALGKMTERAAGRKVIKTTFRFDHRIVDGWLPLAFMMRLKEWCEVEHEKQLLSQLQ